MSIIFRDMNKYDDLCSMDVSGGSNDELGWLLLLTLASMSGYPKIVDRYSDGTKSKIDMELNEGTLVNQDGCCCFPVRPMDPLKMAEAISKPSTCNPFEGYSREEIKMLLDYRGKEI